MWWAHRAICVLARQVLISEMLETNQECYVHYAGSGKKRLTFEGCCEYPHGAGRCAQYTTALPHNQRIKHFYHTTFFFYHTTSQTNQKSGNYHKNTGKTTSLLACAAVERHEQLLAEMESALHAQHAAQTHSPFAPATGPSWGPL